MVVFWTVFLAELGDKTQLATFLFSTERAIPRWVIFCGASLALVLSTLVAVFLGDRIGQVLPPRLVRVAAGVGFVIIGLWIIIRG